MAKVLVLYHSVYGHVEAMAKALAEGARETGAEVTLRRVSEIVEAEQAKVKDRGLDPSIEAPTVDELPQYDAIAFGTGTRYGRVASQLAAFLDQTGSLWQRNALAGKVGCAFGSTASQHGGQETTLFSLITNMMHFGMVVVGLPYSFKGQLKLDEVVGGSPYGATTIAAGDGSRKPHEEELATARFQGRLLAETAAKLA